MPSDTLPYATPAQYLPKPTHHSALAGWSWCALIMEAAYRGSVVAYAYHMYPPSPLDIDHYRRNLGDGRIFVTIDISFLVIGFCLGVLALLPRDRKKWAAALAIVANLLAICAAIGLPPYRAV